MLTSKLAVLLTVKLNVLVLVRPQLSVAVTVTTYAVGDAGAAPLMLITPVLGLPDKVPVKPGAEAVSVTTEPLSVGAADGVTVAAPAVATLVAV